MEVFDIILKIILILMGLLFLSLFTIVSIVVGREMIEDYRQERRRHRHDRTV